MVDNIAFIVVSYIGIAGNIYKININYPDIKACNAATNFLFPIYGTKHRITIVPSFFRPKIPLHPIQSLKHTEYYDIFSWSCLRNDAHLMKKKYATNILLWMFYGYSLNIYWNYVRRLQLNYSRIKSIVLSLKGFTLLEYVYKRHI